MHVQAAQARTRAKKKDTTMSQITSLVKAVKACAAAGTDGTGVEMQRRAATAPCGGWQALLAHQAPLAHLRKGQGLCGNGRGDCQHGPRAHWQRLQHQACVWRRRRLSAY